MKQIAYTDNAVRQMRKLDRQVAHQVRAKIADYVERGAGNITGMKGEGTGIFRLGDWRVIFEETEAEIVVIKVAHRRGVYE